MEKLLTDLNTQLQVLEFTKWKSEVIVTKGNLEGVECHSNTLRSATKRVEECKVQVEQAKIANGESFEEKHLQSLTFVMIYKVKICNGLRRSTTA